MNIRKAVTDEEKNQCRKYLRKRGLESPTDLYLFISEKECASDLDPNSSYELITAVAGLTIGECDNFITGYIEPYFADNRMSNLKLYCACEGYMLARGVKYIIVGCEENRTTENIYEKLGYQKWSKNMNQYIKLLN